MNIPITPLVKALKGSFTAPVDFDYKTELLKALEEKHLLAEERRGIGVSKKKK